MTMARLLVTGGSGFIGTNLIEYYIQHKRFEAVLNVDLQQPVKEQNGFWRACDILDFPKLDQILTEYRPTHIVHLAARTDMFGKTLHDYRANHQGTQHLIEVIRNIPQVERVIFTSTQYVCRPGYQPHSDEDYAPHTLYGQSKVEMERVIRAADLKCTTTIIRPTNIWGPHHPRYPFEFWKVLSRGYYFHPMGRQPLRCYGYVENVVWQIEKILQAPPEQVDRKTFYVGDHPISLDQWVDGFAEALTGRKARRVPRLVLRFLALVGDGIALTGRRFPITSSRFRSMTEDYVVDMRPIFDLFGEPPISLQEGIRRTARWLYQNGFVSRIYV